MRWKTPIGLLALACLVVVASATSTEAQWRRGPGMRGGTGVRVGVFWGPSWGWGYPFWSPFGIYPPYPYPYYGRYNASSDVRIQVEPNNAEVYVDGRFAGIVDDFDGLFQRLHVMPGGHQIEVYLDGYRTMTERRYFSPGKGYKIQGRMQRLAPGESSGPKPTPAAPPADLEPPPGEMQPPRRMMPGQPPPSGAPPARPGEIRQEMAEPAGAEATNFGQLAIRVQPADAEITIDGERWQGLPGQPRLIVDLPAGVHRVEIRKEGFAPFTKDVTVKPREITALNVSLTGLH